MEQVKLINGNCYKITEELVRETAHPIIITDPPFNVGYHYGRYNDKLPENDYFAGLAKLFSMAPSVIVHYPENICRLSMELKTAPTRIVSWVYNSNTARQHRDIAFFGVKPDFSRVRQPYKNPNDKRIRARIAQGNTGAKLYDWWNVNQVKNVNKEKTSHPCQMPLEVMKNIVGVLPDNITVIDPFMGSGTTGVACKELGIAFIGVELDEEYFRIAQKRLG